ncbi:MAG: hypothetical protein HDR92_05220 [Bacteroides sp.]|nr:hypothetical protein [Bacteroides sp.]
MKKLIFLILILSLYSCSKSREDRAQTLIKTHISKHLPNFSSYEAIEFGSIDTIPVHWDETFQYAWLMQDYELKTFAMERAIDLSRKQSRLTDSAELEREVREYKQALHEIEDSLASLRANFEFDTTYVCMRHKFRYFDEEEKQHYIVSETYYFDKDLSRLVGVKSTLFNNSDEEFYFDLNGGMRKFIKI